MFIRFPKINKCLCCCCMKFETAIKVCTILMIFLYTRIVFIDILTLLYSIVNFVSLIFLCIGLFKKKLSFMKQFIYVHLVILIIDGIAIIISCLEYLPYIKRVKVDIFLIIYVLILYGVQIYYYICTGSYIQSVAEELEKYDEARNLEDNQ